MSTVCPYLICLCVINITAIHFWKTGYWASYTVPSPLQINWGSWIMEQRQRYYLAMTKTRLTARRWVQRAFWIHKALHSQVAIEQILRVGGDQLRGLQLNLACNISGTVRAPWHLFLQLHWFGGADILLYSFVYEFVFSPSLLFSLSSLLYTLIFILFHSFHLINIYVCAKENKN